jgi:hypothetical protein
MSCACAHVCVAQHIVDSHFCQRFPTSQQLTHLDHVLPDNAGCVQPEACYSVQIASGQTIHHMRVFNYLSYLFRAMSDCEPQFSKLRIRNHFNHRTLSFETYNLPGSSSPHWTNVCEVVMGMW